MYAKRKSVLLSDEAHMSLMRRVTGSRQIAGHHLLKPDGLVGPHPVVQGLMKLPVAEHLDRYLEA